MILIVLASLSNTFKTFCALLKGISPLGASVGYNGVLHHMGFFHHSWDQAHPENDSISKGQDHTLSRSGEWCSFVPTLGDAGGGKCPGQHQWKDYRVTLTSCCVFNGWYKAERTQTWQKKEKNSLLGIVVRGILAVYGFVFAVVVELGHSSFRVI